MPKVNFYIESYKNQLGESQLRAQMTYGNKRLRVPTLLSVKPEDWDPVKQQVRKSAKGSAKQNHILSTIKARLLDIFQDFQLAGQFSPTVEQITGEFNRSTNQKTETIETLFDAFIAEKSPLVTANLIKHYVIAFNHLKAFSKAARAPLVLQNMDEGYYTRLRGYLVEQGMLNNTIGNQIKYLKAFLAWCDRQGYAVHPGYKLWKKLKEKVSIVTLTEDELVAIEALDLSATPGLARTRTLFLLECYSGLRWSDASRITKASLHSDYLLVNVRKTQEPLRIPLTRQLKLVVETLLSGEMPKVSAQKFNDQIKEVCRRAGIDAEVQHVRHSGAERREAHFAKWQLVTSHTGRRTFVTLSLQKGMRPEVLMQITGHKDIGTMMRYVNILGETTAKEMRKAWS